MADLIDRLSSESLDLPAPRPKLPAHQFIGGMRLYADGLVSRPEIVANWDLVGDEATQSSALADAIDVQAGITDKLNYILRFEAIAMLIEDGEDTIYHTAGAVDKAKVILHAGL